MEEITTWSKSIFFLLNGSDSLYLDGVFWTITRTVTWVPLMLITLYIVVKNNGWRRALLPIAVVLLLICFTDQFSSSFCKPFFRILRPTHDPSTATMVDIVNGYRGGLYGFFSSHAANTFACATFLSLLFRSWSVSAFLYIYAFLCSLSRIYLGVHSPIDIGVGTLFGLLSGALFYFLYYLADKRFGQPRTFFSSAYTASGYLYSDLVLIHLGFALTLLYVAFNAVFLAASY